MNTQKLSKQEKIQFFVNRRYAFSHLLVWLSGCILIYLSFSHLKGITVTEELILLIFLFGCILRPLLRLIHPFATIELNSVGINYRGDFGSYQEITHVALKKRRGIFFPQDQLKIFTKIKGCEEVMLSIPALDSSTSLEELKALILHMKIHFSNQMANKDRSFVSAVKQKSAVT